DLVHHALPRDLELGRRLGGDGRRGALHGGRALDGRGRHAWRRGLRAATAGPRRLERTGGHRPRIIAQQAALGARGSRRRRAAALAQPLRGLVHALEHLLERRRRRAARGAHRGHLELHARVRRLAYRLVGVEERAEHVEDLVESGGLAEASQLVALGVGDVGQLRRRRRLEDERAAQQLDDVAREGREVLAVTRRAVDRLQRGGGVVREERGGERAHLGRRGGAEQARGGVRLEAAVSVGDGGVEQRQGIAQRALRRADDCGQRRRLEGDLLLGEDVLERGRERVRRDRAEVEALHAREHRGRDVARIGGGQHEDHVRGRLLQRLEQRVERRLGELVDLVDDVDLVAAARRRVLDVLPE